MKRRLQGLALSASVLALCAYSQGANAATITFTETDYTSGSPNAPVEGDALPINPPPPAYFTSGNVGDGFGQKSPYDDNTNGTANTPYNAMSTGFGSSPNPGSVFYNVGSSTYQLLWGSPDSYNTVYFYSGSGGTGTLLGSVSGSALACYIANTCKDTNWSFVTFTDTIGTIGSVELVDSGTAAFEFGTVAATPIPGALPLFAGGLGLVGFLGLRKKKRTSAALAAA